MGAQQNRKGRLWAVCVLVSCCTAGCQSDEERCSQAVAPAKAAWSAYLAALDKLSEQATAGHSAAKRDLAKREEALDAKAREKANSLNKPGDSAWYRTYNAARQSMCSDDEACSNLMGSVRQTEATMKEMGGRLAQARTVLAALDTPSQELPATDDDFDRRALLAAAREASAAVPDACAKPER